ncbi:MAG: cysteine peptidase family C39 domain-containing protein [Chlamydiota bacterium]
MSTRSSSSIATLSPPYNLLQRHKSDPTHLLNKKINTHLNTLSKTYTYWSLQKRSYPPISSNDSILFNPTAERLNSRYGTPLVFLDNEIIKVHQITRREFLSTRQELSLFSTAQTTPVYIKYTRHAKPIIAQQSMRGCTAAAVAMLLKEHGKFMDFKVLRQTNLAPPQRMIQWIQAQHLIPLSTKISSLNEAAALLKTHGSIILTIRGDFGIHTIVLDYLSANNARVRDPYHGWEVTVYRDGLEKHFLEGEVIQIRS